MTDLTPNQKIPDISEKDASGAIKSEIKFGSLRFAELIRYPYSDVIFKDEENTGADYWMTPKLAEKLHALADAVDKEWNGLKLRVTEAWDENKEHSTGSLHYEGRAADMTVSDRDKSKLGRLGRLAVDVKFDWVLFESNHIHASVKSESNTGTN